MPTAIVTGAAGGIGSAICRCLRAEGWRVHGTDRRLDAGAAHADDHELDLRDADALSRWMTSLDDVDALVNNAAQMWTTSIVDADWEELDSLWAVNVRAPIIAMQALDAALRKAHGSIINISSVHGYASSPGAAPYAASKGALIALTRAAALEFAPEVRVNAIAPGAISTAMLQEGLARDTEMAAFLMERTPLQRIGRTDEIAQAVLYLADVQRSGYITGQTLVVDGGALARLATE